MKNQSKLSLNDENNVSDHENNDINDKSMVSPVQQQQQQQQLNEAMSTACSWLK